MNAFHYPNTLDIGIILGFIVLSIVVGIIMSKWGQKSTKDYFVSGGKAPWWLLGTSMVATTFAADTPLALSGWVVTKGISQNWFWWCQVPITMAGVFFFARLWKRANLITDQQLVYLRYSGKSADFLRGFKAIYLSLLYYGIVMGWVNKAMAKIITLCFPRIPRIPIVDDMMKWIYLKSNLSVHVDKAVKAAILEGKIDPQVYINKFNLYGERLRLLRNALAQHLDFNVIAKVLNITDKIKDLKVPIAGMKPIAFLAQCADVGAGINEYKILFALFLITIGYTAISGLWGVLITDFIQFWVAMAGCVILAILAIKYATPQGTMDALIAKMGEIYSPEKAKAMVAIIPPSDSGGLGLMPKYYFFIFIALSWWSLGFTDGGSYLAQRMLSAKNEKHAALGYLWYGIAHYAIRMWPWILVGFAAAVIFPYLPDPITGYKPTVADAEVGYVKVMLAVLPHGLLGLLLASFMAAYMSTISTQVNLSASYLVNDFYRPYLVKNRSEKHYVRVSIFINVLIALWGIIISLFINTIEEGWFLIASINGGIGVIYILRWYWHKINAWTEVACIFMLMYLAVMFKVFQVHFEGFTGFPYPLNLLITVPVSVSFALLITLITPPVEKEKLKKFYRQVQPGGPGWKEIEEEIKKEDPNFKPDSPLTKRNFSAWLWATATIYLFLFGVGMFIVGSGNGKVFTGLLAYRRIIGLFFLIASLFTGYKVTESFSDKYWKDLDVKKK